MVTLPSSLSPPFFADPVFTSISSLHAALKLDLDFRDSPARSAARPTKSAGPNPLPSCKISPLEGKNRPWHPRQETGSIWGRQLEVRSRSPALPKQST